MPPETQISAIAHVIQLAIAPVFLISGVATLLSVLANRLGRIVDRARVLETKLELSDEAKRAPMLEELLAPLQAGALGESCHHLLYHLCPADLRHDCDFVHRYFFACQAVQGDYRAVYRGDVFARLGVDGVFTRSNHGHPCFAHLLESGGAGRGSGEGITTFGAGMTLRRRVCGLLSF